MFVAFMSRRRPISESFSRLRECRPGGIVGLGVKRDRINDFEPSAAELRGGSVQISGCSAMFCVSCAEVYSLYSLIPVLSRMISISSVISS